MTRKLTSLRRFATRLIHSTRALGAVEFALTAPFLILMYVGSYQLMDAISAYRKVTITVRSLADLATQNEMTTESQIREILNASRQVMTPYSTADASLAIAQIAIDNDGNTSLLWVCTNSDSPNCSTSSSELKLSDIVIPADLKNAGTYLIYSRIIFHYKPTVAGTLIGPLTFSDNIFMNPRRSPSVCLNTSPNGTPTCLGQGTS
jgi:Flp pilus assembly protein TadG